MHGNSYYGGLVGAKSTGLTRFLEYVDGSIMPDGKFSDASDTWMGDIYYGTRDQDCFRINEDGNVSGCKNLCIGTNGNQEKCDPVLCEKVLSPEDKSLCLNKASVIPSKIILDSSSAIYIPVKGNVIV